MVVSNILHSGHIQAVVQDCFNCFENILRKGDLCGVKTIFKNVRCIRPINWAIYTTWTERKIGVVPTFFPPFEIFFLSKKYLNVLTTSNIFFGEYDVKHDIKLFIVCLDFGKGLWLQWSHSVNTCRFLDEIQIQNPVKHLR